MYQFVDQSTYVHPDMLYSKNSEEKQEIKEGKNKMKGKNVQHFYEKHTSERHSFLSDIHGHKFVLSDLLNHS